MIFSQPVAIKTIKEAAKKLGMTTAGVYAAIKAGSLKSASQADVVLLLTNGNLKAGRFLSQTGLTDQEISRFRKVVKNRTKRGPNGHSKKK